MGFDYEVWINQAKSRLEELRRQREAIDMEIAKLEMGITGFEPLVASVPEWLGPTQGLTYSIRQIMMGMPTRIFKATELRDILMQRGATLDQKNPLAAIHQTLSRLVAQKIIRPVGTKDGMGYQWVTPSPKNTLNAAPDNIMARLKK